jgi:hypothetical protein
VAIAFRGIGGEGVWDNGGGAITPEMPTGWQVDDFLLLVYGTHNTSTEPLVAEPAGWTLLGSGAITGIGGSIQLRIYWRRAQSGDTGPTLDDSDDVPVSHHAYILAWSGVSKQASPVDVFGTFQLNGNNGSTVNAPSITPSTGDRTVLVAAASKALCTLLGVSGTPAAVERADVRNEDVPTGPASGVYEFSNQFDGSTATGTRTVTFSQGGARVAVQFALRPEKTLRAVVATEGSNGSLARVATHLRTVAVSCSGMTSLFAASTRFLASVAQAASAIGLSRILTAARNLSATCGISVALAKARVYAMTIGAAIGAVLNLVLEVIGLGEPLARHSGTRSVSSVHDATARCGAIDAGIRGPRRLS